MNKFELHLKITMENSSVIAELSNNCQLSINQIKQAITKGALWLSRGKTTHRLRKIKKTLQINDSLHFYYNEKILSQNPSQAKLIADLKGYSIWYKPYGMLSQGSKWSDHCTIARWSETQLKPQRPAFIVHRLDRAASGLIIIAHSKKMAQKFSKIFEQHLLDKYYQIIVHGRLFNDLEVNVSKVVDIEIDGKQAKSTFTSLDYNENTDTSLLTVKIDTGRKHQIRKHAAAINLPVVGDRLHGKKDQCYDDSLNLQLCAVALSFICPIEDTLQEFELPTELKPNLAQVCQQLSKN